MVWQLLPCENGKYVWQRYKGEPIVARAASAVTALHSKSKLVSTNHSLFFHIWCPLSAPEALTAQLRTDSWPCWCSAVQKTQTMLWSAGRQCQMFVIFQMVSWKVFFLFFLQIWKFSQVAILKVKHCGFLHLKAYLFRNKTLYFWFLISKNLCFVHRLFENQNPNFQKFWFFNFFSKNNLDDHFQNTRNCGGTHRLPNKTNRNVLASKLRPEKTFQQR